MNTKLDRDHEIIHRSHEHIKKRQLHKTSSNIGCQDDETNAKTYENMKSNAKHDEVLISNALKFWCVCRYGQQNKKDDKNCLEFLYTDFDDGPSVDLRCQP